jgi:hypothetical protein
MPKEVRELIFEWSLRTQPSERRGSTGNFSCSVLTFRENHLSLDETGAERS